MLSPTVIRVSGIVLVLGTLLFIVSGIIGRPEGETPGRAALIALVFGAPISALVGVITGFIWERLFGPIKSVEHLDFRKGRRPQQRSESTQLRSSDLAGRPEPPSPRKFTGKGGGKRRR
ncbi:MAG: hypothetical protein HQ478_10190 [Chloroflexi bacterium]|nr:hypothetical protein [Chloroflexota bacterium]